MPSPNKSTFTRKIRKLQLLLAEHGAAPQDLTGTLLTKWCVAAYPELPKSALPSSSKLASIPDVQDFVDALQSQSFIEATYWLSTAYAMWAGKPQRKLLAMFFTPPSITTRLLDDLTSRGVRFDAETFCDPACGGAAFLAPIALRMKTLLRAKGLSARQILAHVCDHVFGVDIDPTLCALSRHFLLMALREEIVEADLFIPDFRIGQGDALLAMQTAHGKFDVVVCNPPFRKMAAEEVAPCRPSFEEVIESQPNLYGLFMALSIRLLKEGGIAALVTPTSYLSGQYFRKLRTFLLSHCSILNIGMVSDRLGVFIDVEQETALTLLRRTTNSSHLSTATTVSVVATDGNYKNVGLCSLPNSGSTWPIPRTESDVILLQAGLCQSARLVDYGYRVRIGTFVWNRDERPVFHCHSEVKARQASSAVPLLWSSDIKLDQTLDFGLDKKESAEHRFVDLGNRQHTSIVTRPSVLLQRVTSNDQPRRLVAAAVPAALLKCFGGYVGENHTVILEQINEMPVLSPPELAQLLSTTTVDRLFRCISGATNVSAFELGQLVLPLPETLKVFLEGGMSMEKAVSAALVA